MNPWQLVGKQKSSFSLHPAMLHTFDIHLWGKVETIS